MMKKINFIIIFCFCFVLKVEGQGFQRLWGVENIDWGGPADCWAHMPIIKDGVVYNVWAHGIGTLLATDLYTGEVLKRIDNVGSSTAPFIFGSYIYTWRRGDPMYEIDLDSFQVVRTIDIPNSCYTENIPFDEETGYFYAKQSADYKGRLSAFRLSDGQIMWSFPQDYEGGFTGHQAPIVVGDSVFFQSQNAYWQGTGEFYRIDKFTGELTWSTELGPRVNANGGLNREGYNNPIYDEDHDLFYVSESYNYNGWTGMHGNCIMYAIRRTDGTKLWQVYISSYSIESTPTYHDGILYIPVHNDGGQGKYRAVNVSDGSTIWEEPGFYDEDGWGVNAVCDRYLYRGTHGTGIDYLIVQDRFTGELIWSCTMYGAVPCTNPVQSDGIVIIGTSHELIGLKAGTGQPVDCGFHGKYHTGYNPGAIVWSSTSTLPVNLSLTSLVKILPADGTSTSIINTNVYDTNGYLVTNSTAEITFSLTGAGTLEGTNPVSVSGGIASIVYRAGASTGTVTITATSPGLTEGTIEIALITNSHPGPAINLRCNQQTSPAHIINFTPEFSWTFSDPDVGDSQLAYRVIVADNLSDIGNNTGNVWDTEKINSDTNSAFCIESSLKRDTTYYWKVMTWDSANTSGTYSTASVFIITPPILSVSHTTLDFGEIKIKEMESLSFTITNQGSSMLSGTVTSDKNWIKIQPTSFTLEPAGGSNNLTVNVTVDNTILNKKEGEFTGKISITSNAGNWEITVKLTATCVLVKPNPYDPSKGKLTFFGDGIVPNDTEINMYTLGGKLIKKLKETSGKKQIIWDGTNEDGRWVVNGIYIFTYKSSKEKGIGKLTVIIQ